MIVACSINCNTSSLVGFMGINILNIIVVFSCMYEWFKANLFNFQILP